MCSRCSANKAPIKYLQFERVRVCTACFEGLRKSKFFHLLSEATHFLTSFQSPRIPACARVAAALQEEGDVEPGDELHPHAPQGGRRLAGGADVRLPQVEAREGRRMEEELVRLERPGPLHFQGCQRQSSH